MKLLAFAALGTSEQIFCGNLVIKSGKLHLSNGL
uniref:Uncharacterized protein n=1 Tax=Arundo donax TaxID=35708 RepID=A0A0A9BTK1_ARUDO